MRAMYAGNGQQFFTGLSVTLVKLRWLSEYYLYVNSISTESVGEQLPFFLWGIKCKMPSFIITNNCHVGHLALSYQEWAHF